MAFINLHMSLLCVRNILKITPGKFLPLGKGVSG